jgi:hypothetical protein
MSKLESVADVISELIDEIFEMTEAVYNTLETSVDLKRQFTADEEEKSGGETGYAVADRKMFSYGEKENHFRDTLNFSAYVTDNTLAEIFASILFAAGTSTIQSPSITMTANGELAFSAQSITKSGSIKNQSVNSPTPPVLEAKYSIEYGTKIAQSVAKTAGFVGTFGSQLAAKIKGAMDNSKPLPLEAL